MPTASRIKAIHALLGKSGLMDEKRSIISMFTEQRTDSARAMTDYEADGLIMHLQKMDNNHVGADKMRKKIISMAHELNWRIPGTKRIDMHAVNNWCKKYGYLHKDLDYYTYAELPTLVSQFEKMYKDFLKGI